MDATELRFLLKLLGCPGYRSPLSSASLKSFKNKEKICQNLCDRGLIDFSHEIAAVTIEPPGKALLKMDSTPLPVTEKELKVLEKIAKAAGKLIPSQIKVSSINAGERDTILKSLSDRGLIKAETQLKKTHAEVWLTQKGQEYLRSEYNPSGSETITLDLLNNYVRFLRTSCLNTELDRVFQQELPSETQVSELVSQLSDEEILQIIRDLDRQLGTENYLPIFHLRQKLKPLLSREELDQALYRLQQNNQIDLSLLVDTMQYTPEQIDSGIPQDVGEPLFFIKIASANT